MSKRPPSPTDRPFRDAFRSFAGRVRRRLALERMLSGAALGLVIGAGATAAAWQTRHGALRPWMAAGGALGAAVGAMVARRKRWRDEEVALFLDGRLGGKESISTAIELDREDERDDPARAVVLSQATTVLEKANPKDARPRFVRAYHLAIPLGLAAIGYMSLLPLPALPPPPPPPPGAEQVKLADIKGLDKIIDLANANARDDAQRKRLDKIAEDAKKLREKLRDGMEKREAQAEIGKLKDAITAERLSLGEGEQRQGLESALGKLAENPDLKDAAKALGDRDLVSFDDAMENLANKLEKEDRERAKKTLEEAAEAARKQNAPDVAKALEEQKKRLEEMAKKNEKLKELGKAIGEGLSEDAKEALKDLDSGKGGGKEQQKLAEKLEEALGKLTPEERKRLAENMKKRAAEMSGEEAPGEGPSKEQLEDLAEELGSEEGQKRLAEELKKMAEPEPEGSEEGERQKRLEDAQKGIGEAEGQLGAPMPMPVPGQGGGNKPGQGNKAGQKPGGNNGTPGPGGKDEGQPYAGHSEGGGPGDHKGQTGVVDGPGVKSRATGPINKGKPMPGLVMGRTSGRAGDTANIQGTGALGQAAAGELGAIERSDVPEEYREQVGRYFQPK
ncbi:hypothetical protein [Polyangium mundeleinium]|uniref:Uncharacterized protein n=1 Tax=Polyangium mundeleinium TaxID=2995306 RepID=A0ABT5EJL1_9BACT|nr:hypothetical protein [Polyangium mundeleinium]MDC0741378.1 hypothetical protein [Polyangium mundeleinium]